MTATLDRFADAYLVERAKEGDRMALRVLCLRHFEDSYRYAGIRGGGERAESVVRDAFGIVVDEIRRGRLFEPFGIRLYGALQELTGTASTVPVAHRNGNRTSHPNGNGNGTASRLDDLSDTALAALIAGLDRDQQEALLLTHVLHLKPNEVATAMRLTQEAADELEAEAIGALAGQLSG